MTNWIEYYSNQSQKYNHLTTYHNLGRRLIHDDAVDSQGNPTTGYNGRLTFTDDPEIFGTWSPSVPISEVINLQTTLDSKSTTSHSHTKSDIGLGNVDNTSDINKPVSTATQTALDGKASSTHSHNASDVNAGTLAIARIPTGSDASSVCIGNDSRLSDARTPVAHLHAIADVTNLQTTLDGKEPSLPSKTGNSLKYLQVNAGETGFQYGTPAGGGGEATTAKWTTSSAKTANYTLVNTDYFIPFDCSTGDYTATLPTAVSNDGREFTIVKVDETGRTVTIDGNASELINDALTLKLYNQYDYIVLMARAGGWFIKDKGNFMHIDAVNEILIDEDFLSGNTEAGEIGKYNWTNTNGTISVNQSIVGQPGSVRRTSAGTANQVSSLYMQNGSAVVQFAVNDFREGIFIAKAIATNTDHAVKIGIMTDVGSNTPTNGIFLERKETDVNWFVTSRAASAESRVDTGVAFNTTMAKIRIVRRPSNGHIDVFANGTFAGTITTNLVSSGTMLVIGAQIMPTTTTARSIDLDLIRMRFKLNTVRVI